MKRCDAVTLLVVLALTACRAHAVESAPTRHAPDTQPLGGFHHRNNELPHVHVKAESDQAKFWLDPVRLAANYGFKARELNEIERVIREHQTELLEAWHEHLG